MRAPLALWALALFPAPSAYLSSLSAELSQVTDALVSATSFTAPEEGLSDDKACGRTLYELGNRLEESGRVARWKFMDFIEAHESQSPSPSPSAWSCERITAANLAAGRVFEAFEKASRAEEDRFTGLDCDDYPNQKRRLRGLERRFRRALMPVLADALQKLAEREATGFADPAIARACKR